MRIGIELVLGLALALGIASGAGTGQQQSYAVVGGTVFQPTGFALLGAEVRLSVKTPARGVKPPKRQRAISDARGEFSFHVPAGQAEYTLSVKAKGLVPEEKTAKVTADERVDVYFQLKAVK
ncbi:MAG: carboxypeptidase-like regulatory domain-containing protein [Bryobacteraceae bacterium]